MLTPRRIATILATLLVVLLASQLPAPEAVLAQYIGAGGALALKPGPKQINAFVRAVDGDTLDVWLEGQRVAIGLVGVWTPMGNTECGIQARKTLQGLIARGIRLEDDPTITVDSRKRRMFRGYTLDGRPIAEQLIAAGLTRHDGRGESKAALAALEDGARSGGQGCVWEHGQPPESLRGAKPIEVDERNHIDPHQLGPSALQIDPILGTSLLGLVDLGSLVRPSIVLAQTAQAAGELPSNFVQDTVVTGLNQPTNMAFLPDGRVLVAQKHGEVMLVKNGQLQATPFLDIHDRVNDYFDHGLIGLAVDPNFATNNYVYLLYTYEDNVNNYSASKTGRLARYTASGDTASPSSEFVVVGHWVGGSCENFPVGYDCLPSDNLSHSVGNVQFASDGSMFVTSGDGASFSVVDPLALRAQSLDSLGGKLLHITSTGQGFASNPFYNGDVTSNRSKIWTYGLRNPFRFGLKPNSTTALVGNVGWNTYEDLDIGKAGLNQGWPCYEGAFIQSGYQAYATCQALYPPAGPGRVAPMISYTHVGGSSAVTGGFFYTGTAFPAAYQNAFFYGDYGQGFINTLKLDASDNLVPNSVTTFRAGGSMGANDGPVAMVQGPDQNLYWVNIVAGQINRVRYVSPTSPPTVTGSAIPTNGVLPLTVNFSSAGTVDPNGRPLTYDWDFGDGTAHSTAANPSHTYIVRGTYAVRLTVTNNVPASNTWSTTITAGSRPPTATITSPSASLQYTIGQTVNFSGSATDYDGAPIPGANLAWQVIIHHCPQGSCHTHFLEQTTGASGSLLIPDHGDDVYIELQLTATNSMGLTNTDSVSLHPATVTLTFDTIPTGLQVVYDGDSGTTPRTQVTAVGSVHTLYSPSPQASGRAAFASWSDGGALQHNVTIGATNTAYTATFNVAAGSPAGSVQLDGTSGYVESLSRPELNILGDWTVETWFKDTTPGGYNHGEKYTLFKGDTNQSGEAPYIMGVAWNSLFVGVRTGYATTILTYDLAGHGVSANAWHHAAGTFTAATKTITIFVDGAQVAQRTVPTYTTVGNSLPLSIGRNGTTGNYWQGLLDDVRVWNVQRTAAQIAANYNNQYIGAPTGLVSNWRFDDGSGTAAADSAGPATATLNGGAAWSADVHGSAPPPPTPTRTPIPGTPTATPTPRTCPCTIWPSTAAPTMSSSSDSNSVELGVKFNSDQAGYITGLRFYKGANNTGTHVGSLWSDSGTLLGRATFTGETASGWQQVNFASPVAIIAGTTYVASYNAPNGGYAADQNSLTNSVDRAPLHALSNTVGAGNGVYLYTVGSAFPTNTFNANNYWVDVVFNTTVAPTATPTLTPTAVPGTPTPTSTPTNTPVPAGCPCTIWPSTAAPVTASTTDASSVELGVKFRSDQAGYITGLRFYKGATNTGTHVGSLWSSTGTLLGQATFTGETASGWQQVNFASPVAVTAGTTYVASYLAPNGRYAADQTGLSTAVDRAPLHALSSTSSGGNGVYTYAASSSFPTNTFNGTNYWVDVVFNTTVTPTATPTSTPTPVPGTPTPTPTSTPTATPPSCPCNIWASTATPTNAANPDTQSVELGVKFRSDVSGRITGIRFYKSANNTGSHVVSLWSSTGTLLGQATATSETASGWQTATFVTPVVITGGTTYVASYHAPVGRYAADQNGLAANVDRGPLHALSSATSGGNGVYNYSASSSFPSNTYNATNYWVDVVLVSP